MGEDEDGWENWLPVVKCEDKEYAVAIDQRRFCRVENPEETIGFYSPQGRGMVKAMVGTEWRTFISPRRFREAKVDSDASV